MTAQQFAELLADNVSMATQIKKLPHVEDWKRNAEALFNLIVDKSSLFVLCQELDMEMDGVKVPKSAAAILNAIRRIVK